MDSIKIIQDMYKSYLKTIGAEEIFADEKYICYLCPNKIELDNEDSYFMILTCMGNPNKGMVGVCDECMKKIYKN
jgi:hypothetical protein